MVKASLATTIFAVIYVLQFLMLAVLIYAVGALDEIDTLDQSMLTLNGVLVSGSAVVDYVRSKWTK